MISIITSYNTDFDNINCYIFKDSIFYKTLHNITLENDKCITVDVSKMAELYFLSNTEEPHSLAALEEGKTDLSYFLSMRSNDVSINSQWNASEFYSGKVTINFSLNDDNGNKIKLSSSVSQINIDISSEELIQIDSIEMNEASSNIQLFKGIGANSILTAGVYIGRHSVVTKSVLPYSVVGGNPAHILKQYDFERKEWIRISKI